MTQPDYSVLEQAAEWFAVLGDERVGEAQRQAWRCWLAASPAHAAAWQRVETISGQFQAVPAGQRSLAHRTLQSSGRSRRQVLGSLLLLGAGGVLGLDVSRVPWQGWTADLRSATGEVRELRLADGSRLWLNSGSAVDVRYDARQRLLRLWQGELLLDSARDDRPLWVETEHGRMQALGTRFSVRRRDGRTLLSVFAGAVRIDCRSGPSGIVQAGEQVAFDTRRIDAPTKVAPAREAWQRGVLLADDRPLGEFIAELAEHVPGHLGVDPRVAGLRLVGAFPLNDPERIYAALEANLPVRVRRRWPWWVTLEPREA